MGEYVVCHRFAEIGDSINIPDTAVGVTVSVDPEFRNKQHPATVNVCWLEARRG